MRGNEVSMKRAPEFETSEAEERFWDETELTDVAAEEVEVRRPKRPLSATFAVRLDEQSVKALRLIAERRGIGATQLVRSWILERLRLESAAGELANPSADDDELRVRRAVLDDVASKLPDLVAAAVLAAGLGAAAGKAASKAKKKRSAQTSIRNKQTRRREQQTQRNQEPQKEANERR
jgi:predicted HicB family RNase H-like nuclease